MKRRALLFAVAMVGAGTSLVACGGSGGGGPTTGGPPPSPTPAPAPSPAPVPPPPTPLVWAVGPPPVLPRAALGDLVGGEHRGCRQTFPVRNVAAAVARDGHRSCGGADHDQLRWLVQ